jgi:hypothetical protein
VVAICDKELVGKKFEEGKKQLDLRENFYKGEEANKEGVIALILRQAREDATFNIVGEKSIAAAIEAGIITKESVARVQNIPFALTLL